MLKLVLNVKYLLLLSFLTAAEFYNCGHIQGTVHSRFSDILFSDKPRFSDNFAEDRFFTT